MIAAVQATQAAMTVMKGGGGVISGSVAGGVAPAAALSCLPLATAEAVLAATKCSESDAGRAVVSVGSDVSFATAEGTVNKIWIGRVRKVLKGNNI
jgi:hypothetical protein